MYERFTDRARKILQLANQEAQRLNHEYIGTEHLLLGLVKEGSGTAVVVLRGFGIGLYDIYTKTNEMMVPGPDKVTMGKLPQTPQARRVIEYAIQEARDLQHNYIGSEHILLGLLHEAEDNAFQVLTSFGVTLEKVREEVKKLMGVTKAPRLDVDWQVVVSRTERMLTNWPYQQKSENWDTQDLLKQILENQYVILNLLRPQEVHSWKGHISITEEKKS